MVWHARFRGEDLYHHIYAWGNDRHPVFKNPQHYQQYLIYLAKHSQKFRIDVIAYALMQWHVHLFIYDRKNTISDFMLHMHGEYAKYYNRSACRVGHVFGERYNNKIVEDNEQGMWLTQYIHRQAITAGLVKDPADYPWTSYNVYVGEQTNIFLKHARIMNQFGTGKDAQFHYRNFVIAASHGPVDWNLIERSIDRKKESIEDRCQKWGIDIASFKHVLGRKDRKLRHELVRRLVKDYGLKAVDLAGYLNMTKAAISKIVK